MVDLTALLGKPPILSLRGKGGEEGGREGGGREKVYSALLSVVLNIDIPMTSSADIKGSSNSALAEIAGTYCKPAR